MFLNALHWKYAMKISIILFCLNFSKSLLDYILDYVYITIFKVPLWK